MCQVNSRHPNLRTIELILARADSFSRQSIVLLLRRASVNSFAMATSCWQLPLWRGREPLGRREDLEIACLAASPPSSNRRARPMRVLTFIGRDGPASASMNGNMANPMDFTGHQYCLQSQFASLADIHRAHQAATHGPPGHPASTDGSFFPPSAALPLLLHASGQGRCAR